MAERRKPHCRRCHQRMKGHTYLCPTPEPSSIQTNKGTVSFLASPPKTPSRSRGKAASFPTPPPTTPLRPNPSPRTQYGRGSRLEGDASSLEQPLLSDEEDDDDEEYEEDDDDDDYEEEHDNDGDSDDDGGAQEASYFPTPASTAPRNLNPSLGTRVGGWEENASSLKQPLLSAAGGRIDEEDEDDGDEEDEDEEDNEASYLLTPTSTALRNPDPGLGTRRGQDGGWEGNASPTIEQPLLPAADGRIDDDANGSGGDIAPINVSPGWMEAPVIKIYEANLEDIERFREEAAEMGIHAGMIRSPAKLAREAETQNSAGNAPPTDTSLLLVTSRNPELVKLIADSQKYKMPGTLDDPPKENLQIKSVTNLQLFLTGLVAAVIGGGFVAGIVALFMR